MSDLIDRQAVIDLLKQMRKDGDMVPWEGKDVFARIRKLPTIQPEKAQLSKEGTTSDLISRQEAIDAINSWRGRFSEEYNEAIDDCENSIKELPIIQPERKRGEWVYNSPVTMKCNRCGLVVKDWDWHRFKICPNCGADMRGEQDG